MKKTIKNLRSRITKGSKVIVQMYNEVSGEYYGAFEECEVLLVC